MTVLIVFCAVVFFVGNIVAVVTLVRIHRDLRHFTRRHL